MPKMHQNTFGGRALLGPAEGSLSAPNPPNRIEEVLRGETFQLTGLSTAQAH